MKVAVTAASGKLGSAVVEALKRIDGVTPIAVARTPSKAAHLGVEARAGDYDNPSQLEIAFQCVDAVLLVSGMSPPDQRIGQHMRVIDSASRAGVPSLVYTGIVLNESGGGFWPIQQASRATEDYIKGSGMAWSIGRNGLYIEPDLEYVETYRKMGKIANCAGEGRCAYTCRPELGVAYARMITDQRHEGQTYTLAGQPITQATLADCLNQVFGTTLVYEPQTVEAFLRQSRAELGDFVGGIIGGIYEGINKGALDVESDFEGVVGRPHQSPIEMMQAWVAMHGAE